MLKREHVDAIINRLTAVLPPSMQGLQQDFERNCRSILQSVFAKFDLVTREEFDVQASVLAKTRAKLDQLEQAVAALESQPAIMSGQINATK